MITGVVSENLEATVLLTIRGPDGDEVEVRFLLDTGYNGWISLPPSLVAEFGLPWHHRGGGELADGSETVFDIYEAAVLWDGNVRRLWVDEIDATPLLGMSLLEGHEIKIEAWSPGNVNISARRA